MPKHVLRYFGLGLLTLIACATLAVAQELNPVPLPPPQTSGGRPLMQVLKDRQTSREFSSQKLPAQVLSNLLWAAFGVNRPDSGKRTAPSCMNWQEIDIYVAAQDGLYIYDAKAGALKPVLAQDVRGATGQQSFVKDAPVNLVYVADLAKTGRAGEGLAAVVRGSVDRRALAKLMKLRPDQKIILAQTVGYPKK
jgi:hypothetical protein